MKLVVVESPAKAKTINKYLGKDYKVLASYGHIRDLPSKNGSVDPDNDFEMVWEADSKSSKRITDIANAAEITLFGEQYRQELIDTARGARDGDKVVIEAEAEPHKLPLAEDSSPAHP